MRSYCRAGLNAPVEELPGGIRRLTFPLPMGIRHVHCYLLPGSDGWTLVDTGLGLPDASVQVLQGIIFVFVLASDALYGRVGFLKGKS